MAHIEGMRDIDTEYDGATTGRVLPVGSNQQVVSLPCIDNLRQLAFNEITVAKRCLAVHAPAGDGA
jgi:uncharacterized protein YkvS